MTLIANIGTNCEHDTKGGGGGALMNLIMNLADLGKSENNEFVENEKI